MHKKERNQQIKSTNQQMLVGDEELKRNLEITSLGEQIAGLGYFERNWQTGKGYWSKGFYNLLAVNPGELDSTHDDFLKFIHKDDVKRVTEHIKTSLQKQSAMDIEFRIVQLGGNVIDIHGIGKNFYDNTGKPLKTIGTFQDITGRKKLLFEKQESIDELSFLNRIFIAVQKTESLDRICEIIASEISNFYPGNIVAMSLYDTNLGGVRIRAIEGVGKKYQEFAKILGRDPKKMVFDAKQLDKTYEHYTSGSLIKVEGGLSELMKGQLPGFVCRNAERLMAVTSVHTAGFKDSDMAKGGIVILMRNNIPLLNPKPIETALGYVSELLKRRLAENEIRKNEKKYKTLFENAPIMLGRIDGNGNYLDINNQAESILGYSKTTFKGGNAFSYIHEDDRAKAAEVFSNMKNTGSAEVTYRFRHKNGTYLVIKSRGVKIVETNTYFIYSENITQQKKAEEELQAAFQQLQSNEEQLQASNQQLHATEQQLHAYNQHLQASEHKLRAANQQLAASEQQLRAANQQLTASEKELRAAKEKAERNEKYYHTILNKMGDPVFVKDEQSRLLLVNDAFCEMFGLERPEIIGKTLAEDVAPEERENFLRIDKEVIRTGKENINVESLTIRDGQTQMVSTKKTRFEDSKGNKFLIGNVRDISEIKKLERITNAKSEISQIILSKEDDEMYAGVLDTVLQIMESRYGVFGYIDQEGDLVCPSVTKDIWHAGEMMDKTVVFPKDTWGDSIWGNGLRNKKGAYSNKPFKVPESHLPVDRFLTIPLVYQNKSVGLISVVNKSTDYTDDDFNLLEEIADYLAPVIAFQQQQKLVLESLAESNKLFEKSQAMGKVASFEYDIIAKKYNISNEGKRIYGYNEEVENFTSADVWKCIPDLERVQQAWADLIEKDKPYNLEHEIRPVSGPASKIIKAIAEVVKDESGNPIKVVGFIQDITDINKAEKAQQKSEERLNLLIKNSNDIIVLINGEGNQVFISEAVEKITGYTPEELIGPLADIVHPDDLQTSMQTFAEILKDKDKTHRLQFRHKHKEKGYVWLEAVGQNYLDNPFINSIIVNTRDISRQKQIESELIHAREKAEESDRLKSAFLANMSHEIRTPMNGILGFTSLLKEPELSGEKQKKYIEIIEKSGDRMLNTIQDIIDISKIESGQVDISLSEISLNSLMDELIEFFMPEAAKKNIRLSFSNRLPDQQVIIKSDNDKLNSILTNLIKNAIKYTETGKIEVSYVLNDVLVQLCVKDTGIGIPQNRMNAIFNRFEQADIEDKRVFEGSGLGLAISKAYVKMLGGEIWAESEEGVGSEFYFTLPLSLEAQQDITTIENPALQKQMPENLNILIVEDEEFAVTFLEIVLEDYAREILVATTGVAAVEICQNSPDIDLVLMDIKIPGMNGYEATRRIREFNKNIFIVAQTAYAQMGDREKCIEAGCNDFITKPINKEELFGIISNHLTI